MGSAVGWSATLLISALYVGTTTVIITFALNVPQAVKVWRERSVAGVSPATVAFHILTGGLYLFYGLLLGKPPIVVANAIYLTTTCAIVAAMFSFRGE